MWRVGLFCIVFWFPGLATAQTCLDDKQAKQITHANVVAVPDVWTIELEDGQTLSSQGHYLPSRRPNGAIRENVLDNTEAQILQIMREELVGHQVQYWSLSKKLDRHKRLRSLIFTKDGELLSVRLIRSGLSLFDPAPHITACADILQDAEREAENSKQGLWANAGPDNRLIFTVKPEPLLKVLHHKVTLIGKVKSVGIREKRHYLNFGGKWREDFTVEIAPKVTQKEFGGPGQLSALKDRWVKIRGSVKRKSGPMVVLRQRGQLEILSR